MNGLITYSVMKYQILIIYLFVINYYKTIRKNFRIKIKILFFNKITKACQIKRMKKLFNYFLESPINLLMNLEGTIYLIQPTLLIGTNKYKIGMSKKNDLRRLESYHNGTRNICILSCKYPLTIEKKIKDTFKNKYELILGNEYFAGNEDDMLNDFLKIFNENKNTNTLDNINDIDDSSDNDINDIYILSKEILIDNRTFEERYNNHTLSKKYSLIDNFFELITQRELEEPFNGNLKFHYYSIDIINNSLKELELDNKENDVFKDVKNFILKNDTKIIDIINNNFNMCNIICKEGNNLLCDCHRKSLCEFLGTYDDNFSFLADKHIIEYINRIKQHHNFEIIKEKKKYSGVICNNNETILNCMISNVDLQIKRIEDYYENPTKYLNENKIIPETLEGFIHKYSNKYFDNISDFSIIEYDRKFRQFVFPLIISYSIKDNFTEEMITNLKLYKDKFLFDDFLHQNKQITNKYKNLITNINGVFN